MTARFEDRTALVTGAGGGIGRAIALRLAAEGAHVVAIDVRDGPAHETVDAVTAAGGSAAVSVFDLTDPVACRAAVDAVLARRGRIDVLVNNAGINRRGALLELTDDDWDATFAVNLDAMFHLCRAVLPGMAERRSGAIVNTASQWGLHPAPNHIAYNTSKAAVAMFTRCLARDYAPHGVRVNAVAPGEVRTPMLESNLARDRPHRGRPGRARAVRQDRGTGGDRRPGRLPRLRRGPLPVRVRGRDHRRPGRLVTTQPLTGRTVLVTGASRGIGAAVVRAVHAHGAHAVLHYGSGADAARAVSTALGGDRVTLVQGDLLVPGAGDAVWAAALEAAAATTGRIDVLVNNAGAWLASPVEDADAWAAGWDANLALNLRAAADLCRAAILHFRGRGGGIVVNLASRSAHRGDDADHLAYGAAKGGLLALTKGIARGYARDGVLAYAVAPGWVATDIAAAAGSGLDAVAATLPLGEITPPEDVAAIVAFLATGTARHATGATIDITGADYVR